MVTFRSTGIFLFSFCLASTFARHALHIDVTGNTKVPTIESLQLITTLVNTGDETLRLLNHPNSVLSTSRSNKFIVGAPGAVTFIGSIYKYALDRALAAPSSESFTVLLPGQSTVLKHDLSGMYRSRREGPHSFNVHHTAFYHRRQDGSIVSVEATVKPHVAHVFKSSKASSSLASDQKQRVAQTQYRSCSKVQKNTIDWATKQASVYAKQAYTLLTHQNVSTTPRFKTWFDNVKKTNSDTVGSGRVNATSLALTVKQHFKNIQAVDFSGFTFDCSCNEENVYAYVQPQVYGEIFLCPVFWYAPLNGTDSTGGTLVHELSHFPQLAGTQDYAYGQRGCKELAKSDPKEAIFNADSYEYYAENTPYLA